MPSRVKRRAGTGSAPAGLRSHGRWPPGAWLCSFLLTSGLTCGALLAVCTAGCETPRSRATSRAASRYYPPQPQPPRVVALGTLRGAAPPAQAEVDLTMFLFGAEPPAPLAMVNPTGLAATARALFVCDGVLGTVFRWAAGVDRVEEVPFQPPREHPVALDVLPDGDLLLCDYTGVQRCTTTGRVTRSYLLPDQPLRPAGVLAVHNEVWVSNAALHRLEVFDLVSGQYIRSIGEAGHGPGQFSLPRGLARTPAGDICVVDMLNNRVQVLAPDGTWRRNIGEPGDSVGSFGRPKDVAVGPDGTLFVTDAFSQRVHAFNTAGQPLLAFGEPGSGVGSLALPAGIAIASFSPLAGYTPPADEAAAYFVLVSEQLDRPGVRVYGWLAESNERARGAAALPSEVATNWKPAFPGSVAINPHWDATRCATCHASDGARLLPIRPEAADALCLSCHDGVQAPADPHPIGRHATTELVTTPADWPAYNGAIGCLTCHDIQRHCAPTAKRPAVNAVLLRGYDPQRPLEYCSTCHRADVGGRFSPHRQRDATGRIREDACLFCHTQRPDASADGRRQFLPHLRVESSALCLNCHAKHWDLSPLGHVDRPVPARIREWMLMRELSSTATDTDRGQLARWAADPTRHPARLPLGAGCVTCYTCHNPHYAGLFASDSELGALATAPEDRASALRTNWIDLCSECHHH